MSEDARKEPGESRYEGRIVFDVSRWARSGKKTRNENRGGRCSAELCSPEEGDGARCRRKSEGKRDKKGERKGDKGRKHGSVFAEFESRGVDNCEPANVGKSRREETKFR